MRSKLWLYVAAHAVMVVAACGVRDSGNRPGAGGSPPSTDAASMPVGLRAAYIAAVQRAASPAYGAAPGRRGAWIAHNQVHRFTAELDDRGVSVVPEGGTWHLGLSLARYGCDERLGSLPHVEPES